MLRVFLILFLFGCAATPAPAASHPTLLPRDRDAVASVLNRMHQAAANADEETYFGCYSEDSIFMGTDATERWTRAEFRAFAHPFFARGDAWAFSAIRREIMFSETGNLAWFDEDLETNALGPARGSGIMRRTANGSWQVVHYNLALTVPNERFGEVRALLSGVADAASEEDETASDVANEE